MQRLEVSGAVRPIYGSLGVKRLNLMPLEGTPRSHVIGTSNMADAAIFKSSATLAPLTHNPLTWKIW